MSAQAPARNIFLAMQKQITRVCKVILHQPFCQDSISFLNRIEDGFVEVESVLEIDKLRGHLDHLEHFTMNNVEEPTAEPVA